MIPYKEEKDFLEIARLQGLHPKQLLHVRGHHEAPIKRSLLLLSFEKVLHPLTQTLVIEKERHQYTQEYQELTKNFYLKF